MIRSLSTSNYTRSPETATASANGSGVRMRQTRETINVTTVAMKGNSFMPTHSKIGLRRSSAAPVADVKNSTDATPCGVPVLIGNSPTAIKQTVANANAMQPILPVRRRRNRLRSPAENRSPKHPDITTAELNIHPEGPDPPSSLSVSLPKVQSPSTKTAVIHMQAKNMGRAMPAQDPIIIIRSPLRSLPPPTGFTFSAITSRLSTGKPIIFSIKQLSMRLGDRKPLIATSAIVSP